MFVMKNSSGVEVLCSTLPENTLGEESCIEESCIREGSRSGWFGGHYAGRRFIGVCSGIMTVGTLPTYRLHKTRLWKGLDVTSLVSG